MTRYLYRLWRWTCRQNTRIGAWLERTHDSYHSGWP